MLNPIETIRIKLDDSIKQLCEVSWMFTNTPSRDFTRTRKLPPEKIIRMLLCMEGKSMNNEIVRYFNYSPDFATASAFIQQRRKFNEFALPALFDLFVKKTDAEKRYKGYRLLAADGSDIQVPTNPNEPNSYFEGSNGQKPYSLLHLDAVYDLLRHTYIDANVSGGRDKDETGALCSMVDRSEITNAIIIADRGYENFNLMAHIQEKGWKFLIRIKDIHSNGIASALILPDSEEFDVTFNMKLTRRQTLEVKNLLKDKNDYKLISSTQRFDYLSNTNQKHDPLSFYSIPFRVVRFKISQSTYETVITNLDATAFLPCELKKLYAMRWGIETSFRELKHTVGLLHFHAKKVEFIIQEIFARLIMYNFTELITSHVVIQKSDRNHPCKVNFSVAVQICRQFFRGNVSPPDVEAVLCRNVSVIRTGRNNPRKLITKTVVSFLYRVA